MATISDTGVITGVSEGTALITVTSHNGIEETCPVTVTARTNDIDISVVGGGKADVTLGQSDLTLRATAIGPDGTSGSVSQSFDWRVSNSSYASIRDNGDGTATITGLRGGAVKVAAIATDGSGIRSEISVRVIVPVSDCWMMTPTATIYTGESIKLLVNGLPANATLHAPTDFTWVSSDADVATVSRDGTVTAVGEGTAIITATSHNGLKTSSTIHVTVPVGKIELSLVDADRAEVGVGETLRVQAVAYNSDGTTAGVAQAFKWSANNGNIRVSDNGDGTATITGLYAGTAQVRATASDGSGIYAQMQVAVIVPVESFYIIPSTVSVNVGKTTTIKVNGTPLNATYHTAKDFKWESSDEDVATISDTGVITGVSEGTAIITVTSHNGLQETCPVTVTTRTNDIDISVVGGGQAVVSVGASDLMLRATAIGPDGATGSVTQRFDWRVSNSSYASIRDNGNGTATVTGYMPGIIKVAAIATDGSGIRAEINVRVIVPVSTCWMMTPSATVHIDENIKLLVNGLPVNATLRAPTDFTWESSDEDVATVSKDGTVTGVSAGTAVITATSHNGLRTSSTITVTVPVGEIELSLVDAEDAQIDVGETLLLRAVAYGKDGTTEGVAQVFEWSVSNANVSIRDNGDGTATITGLNAGTAKVRAAATDDSDVRAEIDVRVIVPIEECWMIGPDGEPLTSAGLFTGETLLLRVKSRPDDATLTSPGDFVWESSDEGVATVESNGLVTATGFGVATITATAHNGLEATCEMIVSVAVDSIDLSLIDADEPIVEVAGEPLRVQATGYDKDGSTQNVAQSFDWTSSDPAIATVSAGEDGVAAITGLAPGEVTITVTAKDGSGTRETLKVTVIAPVQDFTIPETASVVIGEKATLELSVIPANSSFGKREDFTWVSDDESIVAVDESGVVTGASLGAATITVTSHNGIKKQCKVTVTNPTNAVVITPAVPGQSEIAIGEKMTLNAVAYGKDGTIDDVAQDFIWTSSSDANASIARNEDGSATVTGLKAGTVTITATTTDGSGIQGVYTVKVIVPVEDFTISETAQTTVGAEKALKLTVSPDDATYGEATDFTWASSAEDIATVDESGTVTGVKAGTATITATSHNDIQKQCEVTVTNPADTVSVKPAVADAREVAVGAKMTLNAVAYDEDGSSEAVAQDFNWASSNSAVATVEAGADGSATVTGRKAGTATITATATDGSGAQGSYAVTVIVAVESFTIPETLKLISGETEALTLTVSPDDATYGEVTDFTWESDDENVATVTESGLVAAVGAGTATITVTSHNGIKEQCEVTVSNPTDTVTVTPVDPEKTMIIVGEPGLELKAVAYGANGSTQEVSQVFTWTSSDSAIASVEAGADGNTATVTGLKSGTVTITAATTDGTGLRGTYEATVVVLVQRLTLPKTATLPEMQTLDLGAELVFDPADATARDVEWSSSDETIATVSDSGVVSPLKTGKVDITVTAKSDPNISATCVVTVQRIPDAITIEPVGAYIPYEAQANTAVVLIPNNANWVNFPDANTITLGFQPDDEYVLSDVLWQVSSGGNRVSVERTDEGNFAITTSLSSLGSNESWAQITVTAASQYDNSVRGTYNIIIARGVDVIDMGADRFVRYGDISGFQMPAPVTLSPSNATFTGVRDFVVMSSDPDVVSVSESGYCTINGTGTATISVCSKYDLGYIKNGSPYVSDGFNVIVYEPAAQVVIAAVDDHYNVIGVNEAVIPTNGYIQLLAVALEADYTLEDLEAGRLPDAFQRFNWTFDTRYLAFAAQLQEAEDGFCLLRALAPTGNQYITVTATSKDGSGVSGSFRIRIVSPMTAIKGIEEELVLHVGESYTFEPQAVPATAELQDFFWHDIKERDRHIASMDGNTVTALSPGTVSLTVAPLNHGFQYNSSGELYAVSATCELTVVSDDPATMRFDAVQDGQTFCIGDEIDLSATMLAADGSSEGVDQKIDWEFSFEDVWIPNKTTHVLEYHPNGEAISIDKETGEWTAVGQGVVTITATARSKTADGQTISRTITLYVNEAKITGIPAEITLEPGEEFTFQPALDPADADASFAWEPLSAADEAVLSLEGNTVTALSAGSAQLTLKADGVRGCATCTVTVAEPPEKLPASIVLTGLEDGQQIAMGDKIQLTATVLDEDGSTDISQDVIWDCSNWGIANVEDGLVAPFSMGELTITATSAIDESVKASITVYVGMP